MTLTLRAKWFDLGSKRTFPRCGYCNSSQNYENKHLTCRLSIQKMLE